MSQLLGSFLLRVWHVGAVHRIVIEHIQSGEKELVAWADEALSWISVRARHAADEVDDEEGASVSPHTV